MFTTKDIVWLVITIVLIGFSVIMAYSGYRYGRNSVLSETTDTTIIIPIDTINDSPIVNYNDTLAIENIKA